ncbi:MAG TPA: hypothetical protein VED40_07600 [Azospirillaceae bacterium]|nr:hypothetical protein [Azospirillaceae bacterium]
MRLFLAAAAILAGLLATPALAHGPHCHKSPDHTMGIHGMALFGGADALYAAHLPIFKHPHDYQIVLKLRVADAAVAGDMAKRLAAGPALWTLVPECFELAKLQPGTAGQVTGFKADLVEGHFERGGRTVHKGVPVEVISVPVFRRLNPDMRGAQAATYLLLGEGRTAFLVKRVDARPDFDHIVALAPVGAVPAGTEVTVPAAGLAEPPRAALEAALGGKGKVLGTVYYDTADLR